MADKELKMIEETHQIVEFGGEVEWYENSANAHCLDCSWDADQEGVSLNRDAAKIHTISTGHAITLEMTSVKSYRFELEKL